LKIAQRGEGVYRPTPHAKKRREAIQEKEGKGGAMTGIQRLRGTRDQVTDHYPPHGGKPQEEKEGI